MSCRLPHYVDPPSVRPKDAEDPKVLQTLLEQFRDGLDAVSKNFEELELTCGTLLTRRHNPVVEAAEVSTSSGSLTDLGGPSITIRGGVGIFIAVMFEAEVKNGGSSGDPWISAILDGDISAGIVDFDMVDATSTYRRALSGAWAPAGQLGVFPMTADSHTISLGYLCGGVDTAYFRNRKLWAYMV